MKSNFSYKVSQIFIFLLALISFFPVFRWTQNYNIIWFITAIGWLVSTLIDSPSFLLKLSKYNFYLYIFFIYVILISYINNEIAIGNRFIDIFQVFIFYLAYEKNRLIGKSINTRKIVLLLAPFIILTSVFSIYYLNISGDYARNIVYEQRRMIGGYSFTYFSVFINIFLLYLYRKNVFKTYIGFLIIALIIVMSTNILMANYTTAALLLFLAMIGRLFFTYSRLRSKILGVLFLLIILFVSSQFLVFVLDFLYELDPMSLNSSRLMEFRDLISGNSIGHSIEERFIKFSGSIEHFFKNPITGSIFVGLDRNVDMFDLFGQHSQVLDTFALFGIFIGILQLYILFKPFHIYLKDANIYLSSFAEVVVLLFFIQVTINNITPSIGFAVYFIFPTTFNYIKFSNRKFIVGKMLKRDPNEEVK